MKKLLLSMFSVAMCVTASMANETTFVFDGDNDMGGLTRQTDFDPRTMTFNPGNVQFVDRFSYTQDGVEFSIMKRSEDGYGVALVNVGAGKAGIMLYAPAVGAGSQNIYEVSVKVPNGKITGFKYVVTGSALATRELTVEGQILEPVSENGPYSWTWKDADGKERVSFDFIDNYQIYYINSMQVTYTPDLGGKKECGLAFSESSAEGIMGKEFTFPTLSNPNNLPVEWSSSDEDVATVNGEGVITITGSGETIIKASTEGNDEYGAGYANYTLTVIPVATSLLQMKQVAPNDYEKVYVDCPLTVTFPNMGYAFVIDAEGTAGYIQNVVNQGSTTASAVTVYKVGDIIPAGWLATNYNVNAEWLWTGIPEKVTETTEVTYPKVKSVTPEDANMVVILENVTFTGTTPLVESKGYATTPDGTRYEFQNTYNVPTKPAGTYDVTGVVRYSQVGSREYFFISPIAFEESKDSGVKTVEAVNGESRYFNLQGLEVENPENGIFVKVTDGKVSKVIVK